MARLEEYIARPWPVTCVTSAANTAIALVRAAPVKDTQWVFKKAHLTYYGGTPAVVPTLTISGGGLATPIVLGGESINGGEIVFESPTALLLNESTAYQLDVPALGAGVVASLVLMDARLRT